MRDVAKLLLSGLDWSLYKILKPVLLWQLCRNPHRSVFPQVCGLAPASAGSWVTRTDAGARLWAEPAGALIADISRPSQGRGRAHRPRFRGAVTTRRPAEAWPCTALQKISRVSTITFTSALHSHSGDETRSKSSHTPPNPSPQRVPADLQTPDTSVWYCHIL